MLRRSNTREGSVVIWLPRKLLCRHMQEWEQPHADGSFMSVHSSQVHVYWTYAWIHAWKKTLWFVGGAHIAYACTHQVYMYIYIHQGTHKNIGAHKPQLNKKCVYTFTHSLAYVFVHTSLFFTEKEKQSYTYIHTYVCVYIYIYIYTHTHT
jgi:hypothetical protein